MTSDVTRHTATYAAGGWAVSWLPGRLLDRNSAITAMMLAHLIATTENRMSDNVSFWSSANALAAELGLAGPDAVVRASFSPEDAEPAPALDCPVWCRERHPDADEPHYGPAIDVESSTLPDPYMLTLLQDPGEVAKIVLMATTPLRVNEPRDRAFTLGQARQLSAALLELLAAAEGEGPMSATADQAEELGKSVADCTRRVLTVLDEYKATGRPACGEAQRLGRLERGLERDLAILALTIADLVELVTIAEQEGTR